MAPSFGSRSQPFRAPAPRPKAGPVLAVGSRATIVVGTGTATRVSLRDYADHADVGTIAVGVEVEILAWQPHRTDGTRYRVRAPGSVDEGWLVSGRLKAIPHAPSPVRTEAPAEPLHPARSKHAAARRQPLTVTAKKTVAAARATAPARKR